MFDTKAIAEELFKGGELTPEMLDEGRSILLRVLGALTDDMESEIGIKLPTLTQAEVAALMAISRGPTVEMPGDPLSDLAWVVAKRAQEVGLVSEVNEVGITIDPEAISKTMLAGGITGIRYKLLYDWPELEKAKAWVRENGFTEVKFKRYPGEKLELADKTLEEIEVGVWDAVSAEGRKKFDEWVSLRRPSVRDFVLNNELYPGQLYRVLEDSVNELLVPGSIVYLVGVEVNINEDEGIEKAFPVFQALRSPAGLGGSKAILPLEFVEPITLEQLRAEAGE
jgi:hypothetical protein